MGRVRTRGWGIGDTNKRERREENFHQKIPSAAALAPREEKGRDDDSDGCLGKRREKEERCLERCFRYSLVPFFKTSGFPPPRYISYIKSYDPRRCGGGGMEGKIRDARFSFFFFSPPPPPSFFATGDDN